MIEVDCAAPRPLSKSTVTSVSIPSPENCTGRRIELHGAIGRAKCEPLRLFLNRIAGTQPDEAPASCGSMIACGAEEITIRALDPTCRASTNRPSTVSVWVTFIADGSATSTSERSVVEPHARYGEARSEAEAEAIGPGSGTG